MTPDTVKLLARYNMHANTEMGRVLAQLGDGEWTKELGGFYPSIRSLCSHLFISDLAWLRRFATLRPFSYAQHPIFQQRPTLGDLLFATFRDYEAERKTLDERFRVFVAENSDHNGEARAKILRGLEKYNLADLTQHDPSLNRELGDIVRGKLEKVVAEALAPTQRTLDLK